MRISTPLGATARSVLLAAGLLCTGIAHADDPKDPAMRNRAAREADRETIRRMNEDQLAMVRDRDARYASGWHAWEAAHGRAAPDGRGDYADPRERDLDPRERDADYDTRSDSDQDRYTAARREYDAAMARWREDVAACQDGYYERCAR